MVELRFREVDICRNCGRAKGSHYPLYDFDKNGLKNVTNSNYFCKKDGVTPFFVPVRVLENYEEIAEEIEEALHHPLLTSRTKLRVLAEQIKKGEKE